MVQSLPPARPIVKDDRDDLLIPLASGVQELLFAPVNPFNNRPAFVAGPEPETGLAQAVQGITRLNCRLWASSDKSGFSQRVNQYNGEVCGPYLAGIGENPTGASSLPPFNGGQCFGDVYLFDFTATDLQGNRFTSARATEGRLVGTAIRVNLNGNPTAGYLRQLNPSAPVDFIGIQIGNPGADLNPVISNVRRQSGLPDDCGNPPVLIQPPGTVVPVTPIVPTITINLPGVGPVTVNVELDPIGRPVIIAPDIGAEITVAPEFSVNPDIDVSLGDGGGGGGGGAPPLDPEIGEPIDSPPGGGGGGEDTGFGEPPEGRIWVGAYVQLLGDLTPFGIIPRDLLGQAALPMVVGNACLNVQGDNSTLLRSTFTQIRSEWSEHIVPVVGLSVSGIRVKVNPRLGYRVYPVSVVNPLAEAP